MKNKIETSEAEFRRRLKKITGLRKKRPTKLRKENWCSTLDIAGIDLGISTDEIVKIVRKGREKE